MYCWAWRQHSFETNKLSMFLHTEAAFLCNWSIKMNMIIRFGSTSVDTGPGDVNNWKRFGGVYVKTGNPSKQKHILLLASKRKISAEKIKKKEWCKYGLHH